MSSVFTAISFLFSLWGVGVVLIPMLSELCVVLNWYNGDIVSSNHANIEYMLWYLVPLTLDLCVRYQTDTLMYVIADDHVLILGVMCNIIWHFQNPFDDPADLRHRTEYYDTHVLLCALLYHSSYERIRRR